MKLAGKVALITGAGSGIGRATALLFARHGASLTLVGRTPTKLNAVANEITPDPQHVHCVAADLSQRYEAEHTVEECVAHFGRLDILVNSAGIARHRLILEVDEPMLDELIANNLKNPLWVSQAAIRTMLDREGGSIVNISSSLSLKPSLGSGAYSISKAALDMLTKVLAQEYGPSGIRVNSICPAFVDTPIHATYLSSEGIAARQAEMAAFYPLGRTGMPEEVAEAALYFASDAASWITGTTLLMDGGRLAK
jgi:3-oxoacyl-[acyl-carrier protein] reductase